ncbi:helix-turn-helix transcriptional regulator [Burkholderia sp. Ac-20353]|uniref:helix-turn-helix domain-containing protein n=1 Tax=Burkholderia sp. Ac-20353 TaxID=2703894 RepID=UPI00197C2294|nr:helix-turn-helix transcriptional regulator [Burkholderia sp. Ac-20353]MBN3789144.1 helix-turn-helix transcriptional regulator [Burkholderia sp. Ac-20353]
MSTIDLTGLASLAAELLAKLPQADGAWQPEPAWEQGLDRLVERLSGGDTVTVQFCGLLRDALARPHALTRDVVHGLLVAIYGYAAGSGSATRAFEHQIRGMTERQYRALQDHIDANLSTSLSLADLAAASAMTVSQLTRTLKRATGETPKRWLQRRRVEQAKQLLIRNNGSLSEIAIACGFSNQSHLTRVFVKLTGTTPRTWQASRRTAAQSRPARAGTGPARPRRSPPTRPPLR